MTGGILALDLGAITGWAYGTRAEHRPAHGVWRLAGVASLARSCVGLENEIVDAMDRHRPEQVVYEAPLPSSDAYSLFAIGLAAHVESAAYRLNVRSRPVNVGKVRLEVLGRGGFPKGESKRHILDWCRKMGFDPTTDDDADALVIWHFAKAGFPNRRGKI